jgi:hypothetical protein
MAPSLASSLWPNDKNGWRFKIQVFMKIFGFFSARQRPGLTQDNSSGPPTQPGQ